MSVIKETIKFEELKVHRAVSDDGTEIAGRVIGKGPALLFLPAGPGDSETCWRHVLPYISDRFTCYLVNNRNRGLSGKSEAVSLKLLAEDVMAFAKSIGGPVGLVSWGPFLFVDAVVKQGPVAAVAVYEPIVFAIAEEEEAKRQNEMFGQMGELASGGKFSEAAQLFLENNGAYNDEDMADGAPRAFWEESAPNIPVFLQELNQAFQPKQPDPTAPSMLREIKVPFLLLKGEQSKPFFIESVHHYSEHLANSDVRQIDNAGHFGPYIQPEAVAGELAAFFENVLERKE